MTTTSFNYRKATQALNFLARCNKGNRISKLQALKLIYLADRYHLRKYGRLITGDQYFAMPMGPVASGVKDLAEHSDVLARPERTYAAAFIRPDPSRKIVHSVAAVDSDALSDTELEALRTVHDRFGVPSANRRLDLVHVTHLFPEWRRHETRVAVTSRECMDLEDFLQDAPDAGPHELVPLTVDQRDIRLREVRESAGFAAFWR